MNVASSLRQYVPPQRCSGLLHARLLYSRHVELPASQAQPAQPLQSLHFPLTSSIVPRHCTVAMSSTLSNIMLSDLSTPLVKNPPLLVAKITTTSTPATRIRYSVIFWPLRRGLFLNRAMGVYVKSNKHVNGYEDS